ncbi:MAG: imidazole glycerol phosphate synthase subunit HisH [Spirochaetia bacterium]|nr:imidazole glycerol phosphate synthase subunit HisH [Spirochaetia bacterium]
MKPQPEIVELDFGMGNIRSLQKAFEHLGHKVEVIRTPEPVSKADAIVIPGDGAFGQAMENIRAAGFYEAVMDFIKSGKPVLGVCIGFQILFESSEEFDYNGSGFGLFRGKINKFNSVGLLVPHIGWNNVEWTKNSRLTQGIENGSYFYFVHSFRCDEQHEWATGISSYGGTFTAVVEKDNVYGLQFHPEKSHKNGLKLLENFTGLI